MAKWKSGKAKGKRQKGKMKKVKGERKGSKLVLHGLFLVYDYLGDDQS